MSAQPFSFENESIIPDQMNMEFNAPIISRNEELINLRRNEIIGSNQSTIMDDDNVNINNINEQYNFEFNKTQEPQEPQELHELHELQEPNINNEENQQCCKVLSSQLDSLSKKVNQLTTQSKSDQSDQSDQSYQSDQSEKVSNTKSNNLSIFGNIENKDPIDILVYFIPVILFFVLIYSILKNKNNLSEAQNVPSIFRSYYPNRL